MLPPPPPPHFPLLHFKLHLQILAHFVVVLLVVVVGAAMMGCILFCEFSEALGTVGGAVEWALKLAMVNDGDGLGMTTYNRQSGLDITQTEVRICGVN